MWQFLQKVWSLARPYRARLALGVATGLISGVLEPTTILVVMVVLSIAFPYAHNPLQEKVISSTPHWVQQWVHDLQNSSTVDPTAHRQAILILLAVIPVTVLLRGLFGYLNVYFLQWAAVRAVNDLRVRLFNHLTNLSASFFNQHASGELISRINNDTTVLQVVLGNTTAVVVKDPATVISTLAMMYWQLPQLTLICLALLPVAAIPIAIFSRKVRRSGQAVQAQTAELTQVMSEAFTGSRIVKAYNLENIVTEQFRTSAQRSISHYMRIIRSMEMPGPLIELFGSLGGIAIIYYFAKDPNKHDPMQLFIFITSFFAMYKPLKNLTRLHSQLEQARSASERVFELLATANTVPEPAQAKLLHAQGAEIHFDKVGFAYGDKTVLQGIDIRVQPGQLVALVGHSGSGKTTLANLLLRFYDPTQGGIKIGGVDLRDVTTRDLRGQIAVVTQENVLFNESIRRNIELGRPGASETDVVKAAISAHALEFINQTPHKFDSVIGEKGAKLSGGQRQRLAIARAVVKNAPILLLDEATSALDTESERAVQAALDELMKGRTTICIAHRLSTIMHADVIVVLKQGRVVETGKHAELLQLGGEYKKLYDLQFRD